MFTGASVTPRAMPPSKSSIFGWRVVNAVTAARSSSGECTSGAPVSIRRSYVVQSSASAQAAVTAPLSTIHGSRPRSVSPVAIRQTSPSAQGYTRGVTSVLSWSTVPLRSMSLPSMAWAIIAFRPVQKTAACTDTSTNWASPVASRRSWATSAPSALSTAAWCQVWGTVMRTGRRSGSPLSAIAPPIAASVRSVAWWWA